jgi:hypothetical protein
MRLKSPTNEEVRAARKAARLTQAQASELIHTYSDRGWRHYESGKVRMHPAFWDLFQRRVKELEETETDG